MLTDTAPGPTDAVKFILRGVGGSLAGVTAHAAANELWTPRGGFLVTQECISTPLIPIYFAAICSYSRTWGRLILGLLATLPLFVALSIARLLLLALPDVLASPLFLRHGYLLATVVMKPERDG